MDRTDHGRAVVHPTPPPTPEPTPAPAPEPTVLERGSGYSVIWPQGGVR